MAIFLSFKTDIPLGFFRIYYIGIREKSQWEDGYFPKCVANYPGNQMKEVEFYELQCQQEHRVHRFSVRAPLRHRKLLLPGSDHGGYPREEPFHGSVHWLHVLPQEVSFPPEAPAVFLTAGAFLKYRWNFDFIQKKSLTKREKAGRIWQMRFCLKIVSASYTLCLKSRFMMISVKE